MPVVTDKSWIYSLGGFAYQIKVFVCYALILEEGMQAGFETLEDVTIRKLVPENIDENEDKFRSLFVSPSGISAIQVKRTAVDKSTAKQTLLNWILLEGTKSDIVSKIYELQEDSLWVEAVKWLVQICRLPNLQKIS